MLIHRAYSKTISHLYIHCITKTINMECSNGYYVNLYQNDKNWYKYGSFCFADWMMPKNTVTKTETPSPGWTSRYLTSRRKWTFSAEPWTHWRRTEAVIVKGSRTWRPRSTDSDWWVLQKGGLSLKLVKDTCYNGENWQRLMISLLFKLLSMVKGQRIPCKVMNIVKGYRVPHQTSEYDWGEI